jgi:PAS domain S-box-containing protein
VRRLRAIRAENAQLRAQLADATATLSAIRRGEADALLVWDQGVPRVYTLRGAERPYRLLVEAMRDGAVLLGADGYVVYANEAFATLAGAALESVPGRAMREFFPPARRDAWDALAARGAGELEIDLVRDGAPPLPVRVAFSDVAVDEQTPLRCLIVTDLTEARRAAADRARRDVLEATAVTLREADERKNEFLAMLAHELRNPLAPIRNSVQLLRLRRNDDPTVVHAVEIIDRQVVHMARLVDDLLDVARITRGKIMLQTEPLAIAEVIGEAVESMRPAVAQSAHALEVRVGDAGARVHGDRARLVQVVSNLLANAVKFTPRGGRITVATAAGGGEVSICVRDTGIGIPLAAQRRIFELFAQEDRTLERARGGLGIGLTLVERLVALHGGVVTVRSEGAGTGAEFVVTLPALAAVPERLERGASPLAAGVPALRIVVVEDNVDAAESFKTLLETCGHDVRVAHDGLEALGLVETFSPSAAFVDLGLPGLDGFEVARRLRRRADRGGLLLVALSGYGRDEDKAQARDAGFDHHLTKPIALEAVAPLLAAREPDARGTDHAAG